MSISIYFLKLGKNQAVCLQAFKPWEKNFFFHYAFYQVIKTIYLILIFFNLQTIQLIKMKWNNKSYILTQCFTIAHSYPFLLLKYSNILKGKGDLPLNLRQTEYPEYKEFSICPYDEIFTPTLNIWKKYLIQFLCE